MNSTGLQLLLVDEDAALLTNAEKHFHALGFVVRTASNGVEAIQAASRQTPDIIVVNMILPGCSGFRVLEEVRRLPKPPVAIMTSAFGSGVQRTLARHLGAAEFLNCPVSMNRLQEVIFRLCPPATHGPHLNRTHVQPIETHDTA